jgi:class 3 adenylate cyclase/ketosteroid isomerase-like protein
MTCAACGHGNPETARFCNACGGPLAPRCSGCGAENPPASRFCNACGAAVVGPSGSVPSRVEESTRRTAGLEARKVVTVVFADLIGSTALHERLDAESVRSLMGRYYGALHAVVEAYGGRVVKLLGDGVMAAFGLPRVAEDDALRAVRAAVAMQEAFRALARAQGAAVGPLGLRVAVNTGEVVVEAATDDVVGDPVNVAARLQDVAQDGDVVIGEATRRLVAAHVTLAPLGPVALRGRAETVAAYRVVSLERPGDASAVAFVGRTDELGRLGAVYDAARSAPAARLAVVLGSPGVGKSRLLDEFTSRLDGATVLVAHCEAAGGATFAPIAKALRSVLGVGTGSGGHDLRAAVDAAVPGSEADRGRIAAGIAALLAGTPAAPEETFFVVRRLLTGLAAAQPVVLVLDDLQWAAPLLLDLVEHLVQWTTGVPLLLLATARPDLREARSALVAPGRLASDVVMLGGLDAAAATRLAANVLGADALPAAVAGRVLATSEGNPLFLGELVRMLVDEGALKREGDQWTAGVDLAALDMPPTIHALLAARIERLRAEDRLVLERAAIVGRQFSRAAVAHLLPAEAQGDLDARLEALRRSELVEPDAGWFLGEPALRFHHGLIRDAAYRRVLKGTRAELHARFADWIASRVGEAVAHDETIGWHLEQAHRHLGELGPLDDRGRALGDRASRYLAAAGRRALARDDLPLAGSLLGRALDRLDDANPKRADLTLDWCEALLAAGDVGPAAGAVAELRRHIDGSDRLRAWHTCFAGQLAALTDPQALRATADAVAIAAEGLAAAGDAAGEAKAHSVHATALARLGKVGACEAVLDKALAAARRADDHRRSNGVLANAPLAALWGPSPVTRASGRCLDVVRVLRITQGAPGVEAVALRCQAVLEALRGRAGAARRMIASARRMVEELGITQQLLETDFFTGLIDLLEGDAAGAERNLRSAYDGLRSHGLGIDAARAAAFLGRALLAQGRAAEAEALTRDSEALAGDDLQAAITWRGVRAEALAQRGLYAEGVAFARAAVEIASATDALLHHADARLALAAALLGAGRCDEAAAEEQQAIALWEAKGAAVLIERVRRAGARAGPVDRVPDERSEPASRVHRRVSPNAATANVARFEAAIAARDIDAIAAYVADAGKVIDHTTGGATFDMRGMLATWQGLLRAKDGTYRIEPLATLGDSLALCRQWTSASGLTTKTYDVGAYEFETVLVIEVDGQGRRRWTEMFAADRLGDALARSYERYADLLPDGPARVRATATARSVAVLTEPGRWPFAPDAEATDHRTVGFGSVRGGDAARQAIGALLQLSDDFVTRIDDVLALRSDALLVRSTTSGTVRTSGGTFERNGLQLLVFGADGLLTRWEQFDDDRDAEALARFDELTGESPPPRLADAPSRAADQHEHRVRSNTATASIARFEAAFAARDVDAIAAHVADDSEIVDHISGVTYHREGALNLWRAILRSQGATYRCEPLATLVDSLALCRQWVSASGMASETFDIGAHDLEQISLVEVDARGRRQRTELFAANRLGDAVVRLYERYAELLPDGPARTRAAATARSVAALQGPGDLDRWATATAPAIAYVDRRTLGIGSAEGAEAFLRVMGTLLDLANGVTNRVDDVLALRADAALLRWTNFGSERTGGGSYERHLLWLGVFGTDGLLTRLENFDVDRAAEARARFDELTGETPPPRLAAAPSRAADKRERRVQPNVATATIDRVHAALAARDADALPALIADQLEVVDHTTGVVYDGQGYLATVRLLLKAEHPRLTCETLATLGESLALYRESTSASGFVGRAFDVGAYEKVEIVLIEVDAQGRQRRRDLFAPSRLGDAVVRLYERYTELLPDGLARVRAAATARSVAAVPGPVSLHGLGTIMGPDVAFVDHRPVGLPPSRGREAYLRSLGSLLEIVEDTANRVDDVLGLRLDAFLLRMMNFGTERSGGGAFERPLLLLAVFDTDGLVTHWEFFDPARDDDALARFDELTGQTPAPRSAAVPSRPAEKRKRQVRPNAATANAARMDAAFAARDADAFLAVFADGAKSVHHPTGAVYDGRGSIRTMRSLLSAKDPMFHNEPLATLGESLALSRLSWSASGLRSGKFDVGAYEGEEVIQIEVDGRGQRTHAEMFAADRLGDAVARLYERYADLLPDGPARTRAATMARSVAAMLGPCDPDRYATALARDVEAVDHRTIGFATQRGAEAYLLVLRSLGEVADGVTNRVDDVLALRSDANLMRMTNSGTDRAGGGAFERSFLALGVLGADGLLSRLETFDVDHEAEALARFDELAAQPVHRRVRPNAATASAARADAALAARDVDAFLATWVEDCECIDHPTGATYGLRELGTTWRRALRSAPDLTQRREEMATLGAALGLFRQWVSASASTGGKFDVGAYEIGQVFLNEVDAHGRCRRSERFAVDRLGDAVVRLYERYAELLADGPERRRIAATARSIAAHLGRIDLDRIASAWASAVEFVDHRMLVGIGPVHGAQAMRAALRTLFEAADDIANRVDGVLDLRSGALLLRVTNAGTERVGGAIYERPFLMIWVFGADGLVTRIEQFDVDREVEALARFDELTAAPPARPVQRRVRANAATAHADRVTAAIAARDADALLALPADELEVVDHTTGTVYDRQGWLGTLRALLKARNPAVATEPLATLGDSLALGRISTSASGFVGRTFDVGAYEKEEIELIEVDAQGRRRRREVFTVARLGDAVARLYERYADILPDGPARARAAATARSVAMMLGPFDPERYAPAFAAAIEVVDHRILGTWSAQGAEAFLRHFRALRELADDLVMREDEVLGLRSDALLMRRTHFGIDRAGGGAYERPFLMLQLFGMDGLATRAEYFDVEHDAEALVRFDELVTALRVARFENAVTRWWDRVREAWDARDWEHVAAGHAPGFRLMDRRRMVRLDLDRGAHLESLRHGFEMRSSRLSTEQLLATRGDRLALVRARLEVADGDAGPSEIDFLHVAAVDDHGDCVAAVAFDPDDLDAAYAELDDRYAAGEAARYAGTWETYRRVGRAADARDWEQLASVFAPDFVMEDHRTLGLLPGSRDEYVASVRALLDLRPDTRFRVDHVLALEDRRSLAVMGWVGGEQDGTFEIRGAAVTEHAVDGTRRRQDIYDLDQLDAAWARFAAIGGRPGAARDPLAALAKPNAASAAMDRVQAAFEAGDWAAMRAACTPDATIEDRRRRVLVSGAVDVWVADRQRAARAGTVYHRTLVGTVGKRVALERVLCAGGPSGGPFEIEHLWLIEVDESGRIVFGAAFDVDDWRTANREAAARLIARDSAAAASLPPLVEVLEAFNDRNLARLRAVFADDVVAEDRRRAGVGRVEGASRYVDSLAVFWDLAPDGQADTLHVLARDRHGVVSAGRVLGTLAEGGGAFETYFVNVLIVERGRIARYELFEPEDVDVALARFAELREELHPGGLPPADG